MYWTIVFIVDFWGTLYSSIIVEVFSDDMPANTHKELDGNFTGFTQYTEHFRTETEARERLAKLRNWEG